MVGVVRRYRLVRVVRVVQVVRVVRIVWVVRVVWVDGVYCYGFYGFTCFLSQEQQQQYTSLLLTGLLTGVSR